MLIFLCNRVYVNLSLIALDLLKKKNTFILTYLRLVFKDLDIFYLSKMFYFV